MVYCVYFIRLNGVIRYVGMTSNFESRFRRGRHLFIRKHKDAVAKILKNGLTKMQARELEEKYIVRLRDQLWGGCLTYSERAQIAAKVMWSKSGAKERRSRSQSAAMRRALRDTKKRKRILKGLAAGRTSEVHLKLWRDPEYRQKCSDAAKAAWQRRRA